MKLKEGLRVKCKIVNKEVVGVLHKEDERWFLCQDEFKGCDCVDKKGFKYSWRLGYFVNEDWIIEYYNIKPVEEDTNKNNPYDKLIELVEKVDKWSCAMPDSEFDKGYKTACSLIKYNLNILKEER